MAYEIRKIDTDTAYVAVMHEGEVTREELMQCRRSAFEAFPELEELRMLVDFSNATAVPDRDYFIMYFSMHEQALSRLQAIALVYRLPGQEQVGLLSDVAQFHGINCRAFHARALATQWLVAQ